MNSTTKEEFKTPSYIRKASNSYYQRIRADPKKYEEYLKKRRDYYKKKTLKKKENNEKKEEKEKDEEIEGETILI